MTLVEAPEVGVAPAPPTAGRLVVMFGASSGPVCGVRDYSRQLGAALEDSGVRTIDIWWEIEHEAGSMERHRGLGRWLRRLEEVVARERPTWIVWHYSAFTYSHRGLPTLVPRIASCLSRIRSMRVGLLHEVVYPFGQRGLKGALLASTQRAALARLYPVLDAAVVTTEDRQTWLNRRAWLPTRPTRFLPVCSNIPSTALSVGRDPTSAPVVGVFGFASEGYLAAPVIGAISRLRRRGTDVGLTLIGAPGSASHQARLWREIASREGCADAVSFTEILEPEAVARALRRADVIVLPDASGPTGRKGTLAAALAAEKPVVAFDGPQRWEELIRERAVVVTRPEAPALADVLDGLLRDSSARLAQGARAGAFYRTYQAPGVIATGASRLPGVASCEARLKPIVRTGRE